MPGTYLIDFYMYADNASLSSYYNCSKVASDFQNTNNTTGNWVSNEITSTCMNVYKTTYNGIEAYRFLYKFEYKGDKNSSGPDGIVDFKFKINPWGFSPHFQSNINYTYGAVVGNIYDYSSDIVDNFNQNADQLLTNDKLDTQINQNQTIIDQNSQAEETRKGILGTLQNVFSSIGNIFNSIIELPGKLVGLLIDALKALFVPTDEQLYEVIGDSQELAENFGFVGESVNFFLEIFTSLLGMVNSNGCAVLPEFTIGETTLFESHTFWEEQQVCLNDNPILSENISTIRIITSIVLVCLFIGFAAAKFFNILSKNDSGSVTDVGLDGTISGYDYERINGHTTRRRY